MIKSKSIKPKKKKAGSVKDIFEFGNDLLFKYSDRYSIFDYGEMPDLIPFKGEALSYMAYLFFIKMDKLGITHHCINLAKDYKGIIVKKMEVMKKEEYEKEKVLNALVPLEVIFRFGIPEGSSLPLRINKYKEGDVFDHPLIEFSTKLEASDRYLSEEEAKKIAGLTDLELERLKSKTTQVALSLKKMFMEEMNVTLWDGKFEWGFIQSQTAGDLERDFILVDSIGPDELRLTYQDLHLSKEFLRQYYKNSSWKKAVSIAKKEHGDKWKKCLHDYNVIPEHLDAKTLSFASLIYTTLSNALSFSEGMPSPFDGPTTIKELYQIYKRDFFIQ